MKVLLPVLGTVAPIAAIVGTLLVFGTPKDGDTSINTPQQTVVASAPHRGSERREGEPCNKTGKCSK